MRVVTSYLLFLVCMSAAPARMAAQGSGTAQGSAPITTEEPSFDPLKASKDIEVGNFYLKRGNYDAAIDRFQEAARLQPGLAEPYMKLGQTYEKIKDLPHAVTAYRKYLEVYRTSPDAKKIQKHIDDLEKQIAREPATKKAG
jgi:tetratricopeptide (TPR) repeat protein